MAKLQDEVIGLKDFTDYLATSSDFAFELEVLRTLRKLGFECHHGGTYEDAQTSKLRQFDIRASIKLGYAYLHLAVECKQVRANFPLLVMRVPRRREESYHDVLLTVDPERWDLGQPQPIPAFRKRGEAIQVNPSNRVYPPHTHVGKSCAQIGRDTKNEITHTDSELFAKWSQAISSAEGVINDAFYTVPTDREGWLVSIVLPLVVIPDDRLWVVDYDDDGNMVNEPKQISRCAYYIAAACVAGDKIVSVPYVLSHLEFVTMSGLPEFLSQFGSKQSEPNGLIFARREVERLLSREAE